MYICIHKKVCVYVCIYILYIYISLYTYTYIYIYMVEVFDEAVCTVQQVWDTYHKLDMTFACVCVP